MIRAMFLLFAVAFLISCNPDRQTGDGSNKLTVSVSILPQKYFVDQITADALKVNVMIPAGSSPATYDPSPAQLQKLSNSSVYFRVGTLGFENAWMNRIITVNPDMDVIDLSKDTELIKEESHNHGGKSHYHDFDPHVWMSPRLVKKMTGTIYETLIKKIPEKEDKYTGNYHRFLQQVDSLDNFLNKNRNKLPQVILVYHPALGYFARDYELTQIPVEKEGKEPTAGRIKDVIKQADRDRIDFILVQKIFDSGKAGVVARELDAEIIYYDPLEYDWLKMMWELTDKLLEAGKQKTTAHE